MKAPLTNPRLLAALLLLCAIVAYIPALSAGFIWDDDVLLTANPQMHSIHGLVEVWQGKNSRDYTPLTTTAFWAERQLFGNSAAGYHALNILLHALSAVLLWRLLTMLRIPGAWLAALLFAIHPVNVASVAWVAELKNTLSGVFFFASILAFLCAVKKEQRGWLAVSLLLFAMAGLSKGAAVALPGVLAGCLLWMNGRITRRELLQLSPFALIAVVIAWLTIHYQARAENYGLLPANLQYRVARAGLAVWWYLREIFFPIGLSPIAPQWKLDIHSPLLYFPALAAVGFFILFFIRRHRWGRPFLFAYGYYFWMLLPILGFVWMTLQQETPAADWWQYLAAPGIFAGLGAGYAFAMRDAVKSKRLAWQGILVLVITLLFVQSWRRSATYHSMATYCRAVLAETPTAWTLQNNLGVVLKQKGEYAAAIECYRKSLILNPGFVEARINLGNAFAASGNLTDAESEYLTAQKFRPQNPDLLASLSEIYFHNGKTHDAFATQAQAIKLDPYNPLRYRQFARLFVATGQYEKAETCYQKALLLAPGDPAVQQDLEELTRLRSPKK